jgi:predicted secreted protein
VITRLSLLVLVTGLQIAMQTVEPEFTSLFNGKDFTGWKIAGPTETFTVQDGAIVAKGAASHAYYDGAFRSHSFRNFELKVDIMTRAGSNGGVYILTEFQAIGGNASASGRFPSKGFEVQVNNSHTDRIRTGSLYHVQEHPHQAAGLTAAPASLERS